MGWSWCVCVWDESSSTCIITVVTGILQSSKDPCQTGLPHAVLPEENHLVNLGLRIAAG